jgi:hypothetical protein
MFTRPALVMVLVAFTSFTPARAQHHGGHGAQHAAGASPYAGFEKRPIKALPSSRLPTYVQDGAWALPWRQN